MDKSPDAFRTISEVADDLDLPQHVLRFWESKFPQVRPMKRGGGRRYYRPEDVELLRQIRSLLYDEGYTIKGAQKLLRGQRRSPEDDAENGGAELASDRLGTGDAPELPFSGEDGQPVPRARLLRLRQELATLREALRDALG